MSGLSVQPGGERPSIPPPHPLLRAAIDAAADAIATYPSCTGDASDSLTILRPVRHSAEQIELAREYLPIAEQALAPASADAIREWLGSLNAGVANPQSAADFATRLIAYQTALSDVPASAFSATSLRLALQRFKFWPAASEVFEFLTGQTEPLRRRLAALRSIARGNQSEKPQERGKPDSQAERDAILAQFRERMAEVKAGWQSQRLPEPAAHAVVARHLSPGALLAIYEADPNPAAQHRAAAIRKSLEAAP